MYRNPKRSLLRLAVPGLGAPRDADRSGDSLQTLGEEALMAGTATPRAPRDPHASTDGSSPDSDLEFVACTKVRMRELQREAERLDRAFQDYHRRVAERPAARSPPAPHEPGAPRSVSSASPERSMSAEAGAASAPPAGDVAAAPAGTAASRPRRGTCRRSSATPLAKARRGLDGQVHLEGEQEKGCGHSAWADRALGSPQSEEGRRAGAGGPGTHWRRHVPAWRRARSGGSARDWLFPSWRATGFLHLTGVMAASLAA